MDAKERLEEEQRRVEEFLKSPSQKWRLVQKQLERGIQKGINAADRSYTSHLTPEERAEIFSTSVEKALKGLMSDKWKGKSLLQNWSYRIGYHATVDLLRQRNRNPLYMAKPLAKEDTESPAQAPKQAESPHVSAPVQTPEESIIYQQSQEKISKLRDLVNNWTEPERTMGLALLNGEVSSLTAAAKCAAGQGHKMYLTKARNMLQRKLREFQDIA